MAYDRYDTRGERDWRGSDNRDSRGRPDHASSDDRGFFERAGDEIASWFGDEDGQRRHPNGGRPRGGQSWSGEEQGRGSRRPMNWTSSERDHRSGSSGYDRGSGEDRGYRPMAGNYGASSGGDDRSSSTWGRDDHRTGSPAGTNRDSDRHYQEWRQRQLDDLDRDYDHYCRERQNRFENDFGTWRQGRQQKRQQLGSIREHMDVVGSDGQPVGQVDKVRGDRIILTKADADDHRHHWLDCSMVESIDGEQVRLNMPAEEAKSRFRDAEGGRAMFGREDGQDEGEVNLERSFSGTYR